MDIKNNIIRKPENVIIIDKYKYIHLIKDCECKDFNCIKK